MPQQSQHLLDTPIIPSKIKLIFELGFALSVIGLSMISLAWWQDLILIAIAMVIIASLRYTPWRVAHLACLPSSSLNIDHHDNHWQLNMDTIQGNQLWQATLVRAFDKGLGILLVFDVYQPVPQTIELTIYADQCSRDDWRRLRHAIHFFENNHMPSMDKLS